MKDKPANKPLKHGGSREGAGRKAADGATDLVMISARVTEQQRDAYRQLGGSVWLRAKITEDAKKL